MKVFLSALESDYAQLVVKRYLSNGHMLDYSLISFYYVEQRRNPSYFQTIRDRSKLLLMDSGAHSFQKGKKVDWLEYTKRYAEFIKGFDRPNVLGYFEMDVDNIIGYDRVLELRKVLESVSDKIIPVWHKNRGIDDFHRMCEGHAGKVVAITGFRNEDIKDNQYLSFLKTAKGYGCKVHCLGMTRSRVLDKVPFDFVDSSSWLQSGLFGRTFTSKRSFARHRNKQEQLEQLYFNFCEAVKFQKRYENKWRWMD